MNTWASSPVPISLLLRDSSSAFSTSSRTERRLVHSSSDFEADAGTAAPPRISAGTGNCARCTLSAREATFGRYGQISSQVKLMIGASTRTNASPMCQTAVCALRRARDFGAEM